MVESKHLLQFATIAPTVFGLQL